MNKRFAMAGASNRGMRSYGKPLASGGEPKGLAMGHNFGHGAGATNKEEIQKAAELVGVYDKNIGRARFVAEELGVPAYEDFDDMLREKTKKDVNIL